ncbi:MAG: PqiC family protein [Sinimarinibacterium sp.]
MTIRGMCATAGLAALLSACLGTPETRFYTLLRPSVEPDPARAAPASAYAIEVLPVSVPAQVDMPQFVLRQGDGELALVESRQWAAPLAQELRLGLSEHLARELGVREVYRLGTGTGMPVRRIKVDVTRFDSVLGRHARLDAGWNVRDDARGVSVTCSTQLQERVGESYEDLVLGHQRALARLAGEIALAVRALDGNGALDCPRLPVPGNPGDGSPPQPASAR